MSKPIVRIETPTAGHPTLGWITCCFKAANAALAGQLNFVPIMPSLLKCADIPRGRNDALVANLKDEMLWDYWLWIDDDEIFEPNDICYLVEDLQQHPELDMVGAIISKVSETEGFQPCVYDKYDDAAGTWFLWAQGWEEPRLYRPPEKDLWIGTGFTMIRRPLFDRLPRPWYAAVLNPRKRLNWMGNDLMFCHNAKKIGAKIGVDSRPNVGHRRDQYIFARKHYVESGNQYRTLVRMRAQSQLRKSDKADINTRAFWDEVYRDEAQCAWMVRRYDLVKQLVPRIPENGKVLQYGCGPGWFLQQVKEQVEGVEVLGVDISQVAVDLTKKRGIAAERIDPNFAYNGFVGQYDMVVVDDWIQRMADPEATFSKLIKVLKPNGQMIVVAPLEYAPPEESPEHHHLVSRWNLGQFIDKLGGRVVELEDFEERMFGADEKAAGKIPKVMARAVFKEKACQETPVMTL